MRRPATILLKLMLQLAPLLLTPTACDKKTPQRATAQATPSASATAASPCDKAVSEGPIAWIHDDYPAALACAKAKKVPLVIDWWAPWCHTCLSMKSTVLMDVSFARDNAAFVFVALNTDRESNAPPLTKFPVAAWPTYYVVAPDGSVLTRFVGGASVPQFHAFLDTGRQVALGNVPVGHQAFLLAAERALAAKDLATADLQLEMAVTQAPVDWPRLPDALVSLIATKSKRKDVVGCLDVAERYADKLGNTASASDFWSYATGCADEALKGKPTATERKRIAPLQEKALTQWRKLLADPAASLSVDDRSDILINVRETLITLHQPAQAKAAAEEQRALLDEAAAKAPTAMAAMTYNPHRAEVYVYLGRPLDLVPALEKSAQDLPQEYEPPARLGWLLLKAGKLQDAATWTDKALTLVQGPRTARLLGQRAEIAAKLGDSAGEKQFRERAVQVLEGLPANQVSPELIAQAKQALAALH
jgi:thioredoxin-like negative regulator of GroEL